MNYSWCITATDSKFQYLPCKKGCQCLLVQVFGVIMCNKDNLKHQMDGIKWQNGHEILGKGVMDYTVIEDNPRWWHRVAKQDVLLLVLIRLSDEIM